MSGKTPTTSPGVPDGSKRGKKSGRPATGAPTRQDGESGAVASVGAAKGGKVGKGHQNQAATVRSEHARKLNELGEKKGVVPEGSTPRFNPSREVERLGLYWLAGPSPSFFVWKDDGGRERFLEMGTTDLKRKLRVRGLSTEPNWKAGETASQVDRILDLATETRAVDFAASIAGRKAGVYPSASGCLLVRESPQLVTPKAGDFSTIEAFLAGLLGEEAVRFCVWLKIAFEALRAGQPRQGQAMIIVGPPGCGKSRIQHQIITPMLAGRSADPKSFFFGRTDFNAELVGAEHLLIEEVPSSSRHEERVMFGEKIKEVVANDTSRLHKKNRDAITVSPLWRLSITLNDNPEKLRCLPPLTHDVAEKIIMLQARHAPEFWSRFATEADPRKAFLDAIQAELPAFADYLLTMPVAPAWNALRYGVESFISEELAHTIFEGEPEHHLLTLIDKGLSFGDDDEPAPWRGDAEDLRQALCAEGSSVRAPAARLLGGLQLSTLGVWLAHLAEKYPSRVKKHRTSEKRAWVIQPSTRQPS